MRFIVVFSILLGIVTLSAQDQVLSLQQGTLRDWTMQKATMMKISAAMPGDKFTFKPTPPQRNFGEQVLHVVEANVNQINRLGSKVPAPAYNMKETDRAEILKMLEASFDYGTAVLQSFSDQDLLAPAVSSRADRFMGGSNRVRIVNYVMGHTWDIYGQMVVYLRLNGITPPASQRPSEVGCGRHSIEETGYGQFADPNLTAAVCNAHRLDGVHGGPARTGGAAAGVSKRAAGLRRTTTGHRHRSRRTRRVHLVGDWREEAGHGVHPGGLLLIAEVSSALPAARDRRQRDALVRTGCSRRHPRQPDRRQEGRADDRRDAARPLLERAGDITLWWTWWTRRARCHPRDGRSRTGPRGSAARGRRRSRRDSGWPRRRCDGGRVPGVRGVRARAAG